MTTTPVFTHPLFGTAYYDEYMPKDVDRINTDMEMMQTAGINVIRIAESTWSTCEPQPGEFDFTHVDRALEAAHKHHIDVIVGTPTYAVPSWLVAMHPDVLAETPAGPGHYGARQIMDIVNPSYLFYAERVIRALIAHVADHPAVIGYQVDNETKYYDSVSHDMQMLFVKHLRKRFSDDLDALNNTFGLDYWSNRINAWEDFPDVRASINESLRGAFDAFRREQVSEFLGWQADIVREYARDGQFVTHNFDFEWRGHSYGVQPAVDHFKAAAHMDIAGVDIYHPTEDALSGKEIAFGGDMTRSIRSGANYIVLETQAQGQHGWLPYPGQLRLQAYSHLASGADGVMYWHWHSIHNSFESYWKGLLSHDLESNPTYEEAGVFGREIADPKVGPRILHLRKHNPVAIMVSNESLSALEWFRLETGLPDGTGPGYNDVLRRIYDALFELNIECDFVPADASIERLGAYQAVITPALYCATQECIDTLKEYVRAGGHLISTLRSFVADENVTIWHDKAPHGLDDVFGSSYQQFTRPQDTGLAFTEAFAGQAPVSSQANALIELLTPERNEDVIAWYDHPVWKHYAAVTRHQYGSGWAEWIGTVPDDHSTRALLREALGNAGLIDDRRASLPEGLVIRTGSNEAGETISYLLNYTASTAAFDSPVSGEVIIAPRAISIRGVAALPEGAEEGLSTSDHVSEGERISIAPWNLAVIAS
ncbi:MAG: beta-galactosidase [Bifidobacterium psychraerophilum]|uniref:beta-galactosidase n=1 Tax=Bifidobacterium psychraerophilum TaxID=218140 RepID=UPI0039E77A0D